MLNFVTSVILPAIAATTAILVCILAALILGVPAPVGIVVGVALVAAVGSTLDHLGV